MLVNRCGEGCTDDELCPSCPFEKMVEMSELDYSRIKELEAKLTEADKVNVIMFNELKSLETKLQVAVEFIEELSLRTNSWENNPAKEILKKIKAK